MLMAKLRRSHRAGYDMRCQYGEMGIWGMGGWNREIRVCGYLCEEGSKDFWMETNKMPKPRANQKYNSSMAPDFSPGYKKEELTIERCRRLNDVTKLTEPEPLKTQYPKIKTPTTWRSRQSPAPLKTKDYRLTWHNEVYEARTPQNSKLKTQNPKLKTQNPKLKTVTKLMKPWTPRDPGLRTPGLKLQNNSLTP